MTVNADVDVYAKTRNYRKTQKKQQPTENQNNTEM